MDIKDVIHNRHSVREYKKEPIPDDIIQKIIKLAMTAPSAGGLRSYDIIITSNNIISQINAPTYLVICAAPDKSARYGERGRSLYSIQDATIVGAYIQLIATSMGFSTVWVGAFREDKLKKELKIADNLRPIAIIPIGYGK